MRSVRPLTVVGGLDLPESFTPSTVTVDKGMEMEEMEREEAAKPDGTKTTGADNAS